MQNLNLEIVCFVSEARRLQQASHESRERDASSSSETHGYPRRPYSTGSSHSGPSQERRISTSSENQSAYRESPSSLSRSTPKGREMEKERKDEEGRHKDRAEAQLRTQDMEREASAIFAALFEKDNKSSRVSTEDESESSSRPLTAANLIDVIITRSINQPMMDSQDQGTDSDSGDGMSIGRSVVSSKDKLNKTVSDSDSLKQENGDSNAVPSSSTERSPTAAKDPNMSKPKDTAGERPERSQESLVPVSSQSPLPITLAEHIDTIISMDYNKIDQTSQVIPSASTSTSSLSKRERGKASASIDTSESHEPGPSSSSPRSRYRSTESEVGSTNDTGRRSSPVASSLQTMHGGRSSSISETRMRSQGMMSYGGPADPNINSSKDNSPRSRAGSTASDISSASASPANARPDSYSNRVSSQWGTRKDLEAGRVSRSSSEQSREASPVSVGDMTAPVSWQRKYQQEGNGADSSENASRGAQQRFRVHSSQSTSPQQPESWGMADSNRPPSRGRRRESPKTTVEPGCSSMSQLDASSSSEDRSRFTSVPVESGVSDSQRQLSSSLDTKSRSEVESSRGGNPAPQSTSHEYASDGSLQPADSMSQMRQCLMGSAQSLSRSPKHGQPSMLPSSSQGRPPPRKDTGLFKFDLQKSINRMIESQVRMDTPVRVDTQVRMDDYVTRLVEAEMSSSRSSPQRCDSRESTSTAESGGLEVDESRISDEFDLDNHEAESVQQPSITQLRPRGSSPRLAVRDSGEVDSGPMEGGARLAVGSSSGIGSNRVTGVTSPNMAAQQGDLSNQPSQSVQTSPAVSGQQGFATSASGNVGNQFAYSALSFRSPAPAAAAASSSTPNTAQNHLANPHRRNPSPHLGPVRGPSPVPGPGLAGTRDREPAPLLSSQYETLSDSD